IVAEYSRTDPELSVTWNWKGDENLRRDVLCMTEKATRKALRLLMALPNGVIEYSPDFPGLPQTSLSMGILKTEMPEDEDGEIVLTGTFLVRSSINSQKGYVINRLEAIVKEFDGELTECGVYPAWEYRPDSSFRNMIVSVFEAKFGRKPEVVMIHGGLECGLLSGKIAGLDCVSIGPDTEDIHTPAERLNIPSFERTWELVKGIMEQA
ncbi:MAG: aminoacyl-histidine dipeptidase, partial [Eubacterium sp.]|nr:aminoacyl-histidine dipeptidase [Eubacterium sp.]